MFSNGQLVQAADLNNLSVTTVTTAGDVMVGAAVTVATTLGVTGASTVAALTASGAVTPQALVDISGAAAGQIKFPATQNPSANANTLDDYEEGTWTPSLGGNATYTAREGRYTKIGNVVTVVGSITVNVLGTGSTTTISGAPFAEGGASTAAAVVGFYTNIATAAVEVGGYLTGTDIAITAKAAASTGSGVAAVFGNAAQVDFSCTYLV